jgi:hypothetical protein
VVNHKDDGLEHGRFEFLPGVCFDFCIYFFNFVCWKFGRCWHSCCNPNMLRLLGNLNPLLKQESISASYPSSLLGKYPESPCQDKAVVSREVSGVLHTE